jgi:hypothetical protein
MLKRILAVWRPMDATMTAKTAAGIVMALPPPKHHHRHQPDPAAVVSITPTAPQHALPVPHQFVEGSLATARTLTAMATA